MLKLIYDNSASKEVERWKKVDKQKAKKIAALIESILITPMEGIGKPERLKNMDKNTWSRRIDDEHRLVYEIYTDRIVITSARYHYHK